MDGPHGERKENHMINVLHLLWIVPLSATIRFVSCALLSAIDR